MTVTRTFDDISSLIYDELQEELGLAADQYCWVVDVTDAWAVYEVDGTGDGVGTFQADYTIDDGGEVTLGTPKPVQRVTTYEPATEATERIGGRLKEALGTDERGGRVFAVEILQYGQSRNGNLYPPAVMREAAGLYEGAKAFDHHRTDAELRTSTVEGLVGQYRNVSAGTTALEGELHLLPSATRVSEAFDASLAGQADGLQPLIGISHDVQAHFRNVTVDGRAFREATKIASVLSADVVADPAAGGKAVRMVAGGTGTDTQELNMPPTIEDIKTAASNATPEELADLRTALGVTPPVEDTTVEPEKEPKAEPEKEPVLVGAATEARFDKDAPIGKQLIRGAVREAKLQESVADLLFTQLPKHFSEADLNTAMQREVGYVRAREAAGLEPTIPAIVTSDQIDKKTERLTKTLEGAVAGGAFFRESYPGIKAAYLDIAGALPPGIDPFSGGVEQLILRESYGAVAPELGRTTESMDTSSWPKVLGDSITRRLIAEYANPSLQTWRQIVSSTPPISDFRTQRLDRIGGYGTLPAVGQGAPYQPLTSPSDEEVTYAVSKKGGTEDFTFEMVKNDDLGRLAQIPVRLGRAAAQTLYRAVWDLFPTNAAIYDAVTLFHATHSNTQAGALSQANLTALGTAMMKQAAFGDSSEVLAALPAFLAVPPDLRELGYQLTESAVAVGANSGTATGANVSDIPNINHGMKLIVVPYWTDTNDYFVIADPSSVPTIEVGFLDGKQDPELFVQDDPRFGSTFNADKITWKIRHIWGLAVLDFRGFQRATN